MTNITENIDKIYFEHNKVKAEYFNISIINSINCVTISINNHDISISSKEKNTILISNVILKIIEML